MYQRTLAVFILSLASIALPVSGAEEVPHHYVEMNLSSGEVYQRGGTSSSIYSEEVSVEGATWLRLFFADTVLGDGPEGSKGTILRLTSLEDGAVQTLDKASLIQWGNSSAFFNGDSVRIELVAPPGADSSRVNVHELMVGEPGELTSNRSICGPTDDRVLSSDARVARIVPVGCTGWLIDDAEGCFLTAGHCLGENFSVIEFNVPLSDPADGSVNHPGPEDQYAIDPSSVQGTQTVIGDDWAYFGGFPNSQTQRIPVEVQGTSFILGTPPVTPGGEMIRITGYGSTTGTQGTPLEWDQVQTTHLGPLTSVSGTVLQ